MPLVFNGTTIPTNVANALMYNGVSVTQVIFNGTTVWQQSLCTVCSGWSGDSVATQLYSYFGLSTSGMLMRVRWSSTYGGWLTVTSAGVFISGTSVEGTSGAQHQINFDGGTGLRIGNMTGYNVWGYSPWAYFNTSNKTFSGGGSYQNSRSAVRALETSGNYIRINHILPIAESAPWISLT